MAKSSIVVVAVKCGNTAPELVGGQVGPARLSAKGGSAFGGNFRARPPIFFGNKKIESKYPGTDLLLPSVETEATIGPGLLNYRVRNGNGCDQPGSEHRDI